LKVGKLAASCSEVEDHSRLVVLSTKTRVHQILIEAVWSDEVTGASGSKIRSLYRKSARVNTSVTYVRQIPVLAQYIKHRLNEKALRKTQTLHTHWL